MLKIAAASCLLALLWSCHPAKQVLSSPAPAPVQDTPGPGVAPQLSRAHTDVFLEQLLAGRPDWFQPLLNQRRDLKLQIIYTRIDRKANNEPVFTPYYFNVDTADYFYPASTVKMPVALLSLEKLRALKVAGLDKNTAMLTGTGFSGQTEVLNDPTAVDGVPSIAQYIKKIFLVSDNDAFNRLYEFLGQESINRSLAAKGYGSANIYHRLSLPMTEEENRHTNPVRFVDSTGATLYEQAPAVSRLKYANRHDLVGKGYYDGTTLVQAPLDFSRKNRFSLEDLTRVLRTILFPASMKASDRFQISEDDYSFVWKYMSEFPGESPSPDYQQPEIWDTYCKFLYYGSDPKAGTRPASFRIFNKVGDAYGFLTDVAYVVDFEKNIEFMLSATIYCNADGIINDDHYDYDTVGLPFMQHLGQLIYDYELTRERKHQPDLSNFRMVYDKK